MLIKSFDKLIERGFRQILFCQSTCHVTKKIRQNHYSIFYYRFNTSTFLYNNASTNNSNFIKDTLRKIFFIYTIRAQPRVY